MRIGGFLRRERLEQRLRFFQIERIEPFIEPIVDRSKQIAQVRPSHFKRTIRQNQKGRQHENKQVGKGESLGMGDAEAPRQGGPVMNPQDLATAGPSITKAGQQYGK